jgi:hypothetical protein
MKTVTGRLVLDEHVASVVEFMERQVPADRLEYVATRLPAIARVIWAPERCAHVYREPIRATRSTASESCPAGPCVGDDSVVEEGVDVLK